MSAVTRPELSSRERDVLAAAARDADGGMRVRAEAVQRWYDGESQAGVAARANVSTTTIRRWVSDSAETGTVPAGARRQTEFSTLHSPRGGVALAARQFLAALATEVRDVRRTRGLSRTELVTACGVGYSVAILGHWERGTRAMPIVVFAILCRGLDFDPGEVIQRCYDESFAQVRGLPR